MSDTKAMQRLCGLMRKAVQQYEMLAPGDRVLVGVSGGKDSVALTIGLARLRQHLGFPFEVVAVTLDPQFGGKPVDYSALKELFRQKALHALQESGIDGWRPLHPARTSKKEDTAHADARI